MFTKLLLSSAIIMTIEGCAAVQRENALLLQPSSSCLKEVKQKVRQLAGNATIHLSDTVFQKYSLLLLTNAHQRSWGRENRMSGVVGSQKPMRLFMEAGECQIGLLDQDGKIVRKSVLKHCHCKGEPQQ